MSLATVEELTARLGLTDLDEFSTGKAQALLDDVSALVVAHCGRDFALHTGEEITVHADSPLVVTIPWWARPVISVHAVTTADGTSRTDYRRDGGTLTVPGYPWWPSGPITVRLDYGYQQVPADVRAVVLGEAAARFNATPGLSTESVGDLTATYRSGGVELSRAARRGLRRYRPPVRSLTFEGG